MSDAIEIIQYKLNEGVRPADYLEANKAVTEWAKALPGFKFHTISSDDDGLWTEALYWENMDHAQGAHDRFMQDLGNGAFLPMIEHSSMSMKFGTVQVMESL